MTDQGPMEPGYRARAEAAEARVAELEAERDRWKDMHDTLARDLQAGDF